MDLALCGHSRKEKTPMCYIRLIKIEARDDGNDCIMVLVGRMKTLATL